MKRGRKPGTKMVADPCVVAFKFYGGKVLDKALAKEARRSGRSRSAVMREALEKFLREGAL